MNFSNVRPMKTTVAKGPVYCTMCTHTVEADIVYSPKRPFVKPGQKCPRCSSALDSAYVLSFDRAA